MDMDSIALQQQQHHDQIFYPIQSLPSVDVRREIESLHLRISKLQRELDSVKAEQQHTQQSMGQVIITYSKCTDVLSQKIEGVMQQIGVSMQQVREECTKFTKQQLTILQTMWTKSQTEHKQQIEMVMLSHKENQQHLVMLTNAIKDIKIQGRSC